ncbi:hypothetical protein D6D12_03102 [Aureobasidium pullulans]|uniref:Apple domain-containing protein n=1 Tax=Aureobasidium pullulans TaxID=5580 RepID=A0AB74JZV2_AURPU|nr:hypothetical protein D6D12_03102 [Aureobasidium pullulans]THX65373.1 hypothetical protein D6D11_00504 [Aureobasidium pullulans]
MRPYSALLAIGFAALVSGQTPGSDGQITVATATCTAIGTQTYAVTDAQGILYRYQCGAGTFGAQFSAVPSSSVGNWTACFAFCDNAPGCSGFTYVNGAPNGNGPGGCNLKSGTAQSLNSDGLVSTRIGAIMARYGPKPAPTNSCPAQNLQTITDFNGVNYVIACGNDTNGNGVTALGANYGFNECFDKCDSYTASTSPSVCNAFQWVGAGANGVGGGNCYLKFCRAAIYANGVCNLKYDLSDGQITDSPGTSLALVAKRPYTVNGGTTSIVIEQFQFIIITKFQPFFIIKQ